MSRELAVVDIGSNAVRCTRIAQDRDGRARFTKHRRFGIRLGTDAYRLKQFSPETIEAFETVMEQVVDFVQQTPDNHITLVGTAAMRAAENRDALIDRIEKKHGLRIQVITGQRESEFTQMALARHIGWLPGQTISVDLGGGSLEIGLLGSKRRISLSLGTVWVLEQFPECTDAVPMKTVKQCIDLLVEKMHRDLEKFTEGGPIQTALAAGGTYQVMHKQIPVHQIGLVPEIDLSKVRPLLNKMARLSCNERMTAFGIRRDRADLMLPGMMITAAWMRALPIKRLLVPGTGLREGVLFAEERDRLKRLWNENKTFLSELFRRFGVSRERERAFYHTTKTFFRLWGHSFALHHRWDEGALTVAVGKAFELVGGKVSSENPYKHGAYVARNAEGLPPAVVERAMTWFSRRGRGHFVHQGNALWEVAEWQNLHNLHSKGVHVMGQEVRLITAQDAMRIPDRIIESFSEAFVAELKPRTTKDDSHASS